MGQVNKCVNCGATFNCNQTIDGKQVKLHKRKFCLSCSPYRSKSWPKQNYGSAQLRSLDELDSQVFRSIIDGNDTLKETLSELKKLVWWVSYRRLRERILKEGLSFTAYSHKWKKSGIEYVANSLKTPLCDILIEESGYPSSTLKRRLISEGLLQDVCSSCNIENTWNNKPLTLQLDHINGVSSDNRIENLRILCPNCHTQTGNYGGRNTEKRKRIKENE